MSPLERLGRWPALRSGMLLLCLTLFGMGARAAVSSRQEVGPIVALATASMADMQSMPAALDGRPCAVCYVAPAPSTHGFSGENQEPKEPGWPACARPAADSAWRFDTGGWRPRWPVRIAFCRWLD
ncbi:MAG: hypothetical protein ACREXQ_08160 [Polaromonas sp.]